MNGGVLGWETSEQASLMPSYAIGSRTLISEYFPEMRSVLNQLSSTGSITLGTFKGELYAFIFREQLQTDAPYLVEWCRHHKKNFVVLSGDDPAPVHELGQK
jgi:cation transport ATPase